MNFLKWFFYMSCWVALIITGMLVATGTTGCTTTSWEYGMMQEANVACADNLEALEASLQRRGFKLACK